MGKGSNIIKTMDGDCEKQDSDPLPSFRDILQSVGIRCTTEVDDRFDWWLLAWNFRVLPAISGLLYIILLIIQN